MIEVEKKFELTEENLESLTRNAEFLKEITFTDTYYDTENYTLAKKDYWLRKRDDKWELKAPFNQDHSRQIQQYRELTSREEIEKELNAKIEQFTPFVTCKTTRKKYKKGKFTIDLDTVEYDNGTTYRVGEIELEVEENQTEQAIQEINQFAQEHNLEFKYVQGKIRAYLNKYKPEHYEAIMASQSR